MRRGGHRGTGGVPVGGVNPGFRRLSPQYLFREIQKRRIAYETGHPADEILSLGVGDVTRPLAPCITAATASAAHEMETLGGFHGYPPAFGYDFLRRAIAARYAARGVKIAPGEVYVSDGAKTDAAMLPHLFGQVTVVLADPAYPVYRDAHLLAGHRVRYLAATPENRFLPTPDGLPPTPHIVYLTSPGNPIGVAYDRAGLGAWVDYARGSRSLLVFDAAYEAFLGEGGVHSIFEIPGAHSCAIELGSFSKSAGFTGMRCAWSVCPQETAFDGEPLLPHWERLKSMSSNGVSYPVQRAAEAALTEEGLLATGNHVRYYLANARLLARALTSAGIPFVGGEISPYLWMRCPGGETSWAYFDRCLQTRQVIVTPGVGFGGAGEGYVRLSALGTRDTVRRAAERLFAT